MQGKFYKSVDEIPLFNWMKCSNNEVRYILIQEDETINDEQCNEAFELLYDKYIETAGIDHELKKILKLVQKLGVLSCDRVIKGDRHINTQIKLVEAEIEALKSKRKESNHTIEDTLATLSKHFGYFIDWKVISKAQFDALLRKFANDHKNQDNG